MANVRMDTADWLRSDGFRRTECLARMEKWAPLYYEADFYGEFHRALRLAIDDFTCESSSAPIAFLVLSNSVLDSIRLSAEHLHHALESVLWNPARSAWMQRIESALCIPTFIRRAVELTVSLDCVFKPRWAVQTLVDMGHYADHIKSHGDGNFIALYRNGIRVASTRYRVETVSAACLAVAAWISNSSGDEILDIYLKIRDGIQNDGHDSTTYSIFGEIFEMESESEQEDPVAKIFWGAAGFFKEIRLPVEECADVNFIPYSAGERIQISEQGAQLTLSAWKQLIGDGSVYYEDGFLYVSPEYAARLQRYAILPVLASRPGTVPLYPMLVRSYMQALYDMDTKGMECVVRALTLIISESYPPITITESTLPMMAMLHCIIARFPTRLWDLAMEMYGRAEQLKIYSPGGAGQESKITGIDMYTNNLYTALLAFLDLHRNHIISFEAIDLLKCKFNQDPELQHKYYPHFAIINKIFDVRIDSDTILSYGAYVDIPQQVDEYPLPPVAYLYSLLIGDMLEEVDVRCVFMGIRLRPEKNTSMGMGETQEIPPRRGDWNDLQAFLHLENVAESMPVVYPPLPSAPANLTAFMNLLACIEFLGYFQAIQASEVNTAQMHIKNPGIPHAPADNSTYRGCVSIYDILPYTCAAPLRAVDLYKMESVNGWQGSVLPMYTIRKNAVESTKSPLFNSHPLLLHCLFSYPISVARMTIKEE